MIALASSRRGIRRYSAPALHYIHRTYTMTTRSTQPLATPILSLRLAPVPHEIGLARASVRTAPSADAGSRSSDNILH
jgi:hypothetical protein